MPRALKRHKFLHVLSRTVDLNANVSTLSHSGSLILADVLARNVCFKPMTMYNLNHYKVCKTFSPSSVRELQHELNRRRRRGVQRFTRTAHTPRYTAHAHTLYCTYTAHAHTAHTPPRVRGKSVHFGLVVGLSRPSPRQRFILRTAVLYCVSYIRCNVVNAGARVYAVYFRDHKIACCLR